MADGDVIRGIVLFGNEGDVVWPVSPGEDTFEVVDNEGVGGDV